MAPIAENLDAGLVGEFRSILGAGLPDDWEMTTLGEAFKWGSGGTPKSTNKAYYGGDIPWLIIGDLNDEVVADSATKITEAGLANSSAKWVEPGSVLLAMYGSIGKLGLAASRLTTNQAIAFTKPEQDDPKYLFYYLMYVRNKLARLGKGATQKNISQTVIKAFPYVRAPVIQQPRIVAEIEKQFSRLGEAVASLKRVKANLKRYKAAVLKAAVEGKLLPSIEKSAFDEGNYRPLSELIESIGQGWSPKCEREASLNDDDWGVIKTTAIQPMEYDSIENKRLPVQLEPKSKHEIVAGDIIVTRAGPRNRVGVSCLVRRTRPKLMICDKVYLLKANRKIIRPAYLELVLNSPQIVDALDALKTGISDSGLNLTQKRFLELRIPVPDLEIQKLIEATVDNMSTNIDSNLAAIAMSEKRAGALRQSILSEAFTGGLSDAAYL